MFATIAFDNSSLPWLEVVSTVASALMPAASIVLSSDAGLAPRPASLYRETTVQLTHSIVKPTLFI
jgi:hypothetical protein